MVQLRVGEAAKKDVRRGVARMGQSSYPQVCDS